MKKYSLEIFKFMQSKTPLFANDRTLYLKFPEDKKTPRSQNISGFLYTNNKFTGEGHQEKLFFSFLKENIKST